MVVVIGFFLSFQSGGGKKNEQIDTTLGKKRGKRRSENSRKSVRWSAVPVALKLVNVRYEGERGSGPKGANDLCLARIGVLRRDFSPKEGIGAMRLELEQ